MVLAACSMQSLPPTSMTGQAWYTLLEGATAKGEREEETLYLLWVTLCLNSCRKDVVYWILDWRSLISTGWCLEAHWYCFIEKCKFGLKFCLELGQLQGQEALLCGVPTALTECLQQGSWPSSLTVFQTFVSLSSLGDNTHLVQKLLWGETNKGIRS